MSERYSVSEHNCNSITGGEQGEPGARKVSKGCFPIAGEWVLYTVEPPVRELPQDPWLLLPADQEMLVKPIQNESGMITALELELSYEALTSRTELKRIREIAGQVIELTLNGEEENEPAEELGKYLHRGGMIELEDWMTELPEY